MSFIAPIMFSLMSAVFISRNAALAEWCLKRTGVQASSNGYDRRKLLFRLWFICFGTVCVAIGLLGISRAFS